MVSRSEATASIRSQIDWIFLFDPESAKERGALNTSRTGGRSYGPNIYGPLIP